MFGPVNPTPFDLYFSLFRIPVRVIPTFWLVGVLFAYPLLRDGELPLLLVWLGCLFFSILVHELGHALVAQAYGWPPKIFLYHFGGLAMFEPWRGFTTKRSVLVSLAGPGAGFLLYGLVIAVEFILRRQGINTSEDFRPLGFAFAQLKYINLYWGLVNLLPVLPLDGGRICDALCVRYLRRGDPVEVTLKIGIAVGIAASLFFFLQERRYPGFLFAFLALQNFQDYQARRGGGSW